jgi:hypothetical protein
MSGLPDGKGTILLVSTGVILVGGAALAVLLGGAARANARYDRELAALNELIPQVTRRVRTEATAALGGNVLGGGGGFIGENSDSRRSAEWTFGLRHVEGGKEKDLVKLTVRIRLEGLLGKRHHGIRVLTTGAPYEARFLELLREALRAKGLEIAAVSP